LSGLINSIRTLTFMNLPVNLSIQEPQYYANRDRKPPVRQPTKLRVKEIIEFAKKWNIRNWVWLIVQASNQRPVN